METKVFYTVFLLMYIIFSFNAVDGIASSSTSEPDLEEEFIIMNESRKQLELPVTGNTKYNITMEKVCINYKLSVAILEATCVNPSQLKFNERRNAVWNCQTTSETIRVYDSGTNTLSIRVPEEWGKNNATLLVTPYFVPSEKNNACPGVPENYFECQRCQAPITNIGEEPYDQRSTYENASSYVTNIQPLRYIHKDLQCNGCVNCNLCEKSDESNDACAFQRPNSAWKIHNSQYLLAILVGIFILL